MAAFVALLVKLPRLLSVLYRAGEAVTKDESTEIWRRLQVFPEAYELNDRYIKYKHIDPILSFHKQILYDQGACIDA